MVSQVSFDCEACIDNENLGNKSGDSGVLSCSPDQAGPKIPVKKQTRQWAAWTRQEEESFFAALRQVGKNFEKITCRVQSKNKDQVRHYYYRLVRRMNKLLGPDLCLDAKNSKDTNAAMLRWWSLLEKHSCKASKLHLKPRRFKIFIETLENQLLKDRKRNVRKRIPGVENNSSAVNIPASSQVKTPIHDSRAVKFVLVDNQNIQKMGNGKGSLSKRHVNIEMNRTSSRIDPTLMKAAKHRRKTAAYKRWETAAIAGVTLVADAAEHLERVSYGKEIGIDQETPGHDGSQQVVEVAHPLPISTQVMFNDNNIQNSTKLKLQLFPIDDCTRKVLEMDHHNPYLELTLSTRKKISSVLEHLNRKWGNSYFMSQELILFPYWAQRENVAGSQKWSKDCSLCAADIYHLIGSPPVFRLRYGWFTKAETELATAKSLSCANFEDLNLSMNVEKEQSISPSGFYYDHHTFTSEKTAMSTRAPITRTGCCGSSSDVNISRYSPAASSPGRDAGDFTLTNPVENRKNLLSAGEWADSLTNISVGDLLSDSTHNMGTSYSNFPVPINSECHSQMAFSCESFDAAIAAHIRKHQSGVNLQEDLPSHVPSILDAEETCDAFAFQKQDGALCDNSYSTVFQNDSPEAHEQASEIGSPPLYKELEELPNMEKLATPFPVCGNLMDDCRPAFTSENSTKDIDGFNDLYWPDSLGPLDLDTPRCRYTNEELILSDSLGGLNRLIASSLDAFQSCSFFGLDKKEPESTVEHCQTQTSSFSELKIGTDG